MRCRLMQQEGLHRLMPMPVSAEPLASPIMDVCSCGRFLRVQHGLLLAVVGVQCGMQRRSIEELGRFGR